MNKRRLISAICLISSIALLSARAESVDPEQDDPTYVIPVEGNIDKALLYVIRRGIRQAEAGRAGAVIFVIDTPGGQLDAADEIVRMLLSLEVPTYAFVKGHAFSAGAIIAMATDRIYMAPGSVIGAAAPIMISPMGGVQEIPENIQEKILSGVAALIRSAAEQKGYDPQLAEAMVRKEKEFRVGDRVISPSGELLTLTNTEAEQPVGEDQRHLLSSGTVKDLDELLRVTGRGGGRVIILEVTGAERIARVISSLSVFLLAGGLIFLFLEFKTPGFGIFGIAGLTCLAVFFWGHHIAGLTGMEDMLAFLVGAALLVTEVFFIPGFGIVGVAGILLMIFGLFSAMIPRITDISSVSFGNRDLHSAVTVIFGALALAGAVALVLFPRASGSRVFRWISLDKSVGRNDGFTAAEPRDDLVGTRGKAVSALRPGGTGEFKEQRLDVVTTGEFLDAGTPIRIVEARGRRIVVEKDEPRNA